MVINDENGGMSKKEEKKRETDIQIRKVVNLKPLDPVPEIEWWDQFFLPESSEEKKFSTTEVKESDLFLERITHYVQHPIPIKNEHIENINSMVVPIHLTEKEKKKIRRTKRMDKEKDK